MYRVRSADGRIEEGQIEADSRELALQSLRSQGSLVLRLDEVRGRSARHSNKQLVNMSLLDKMQRIGTIPTKKKMIFFRQMATMIKAGLGISQAVDIAAAQENNMILKDGLVDVKNRMDRGIPFSQAMEAHPKIFNSMMTSLVQSGEEGGILDNALERVACFLEKQEAIKSRIRSAMFYPSFVILFAISVVVVFIVFILPQFRTVFEQMEIELPGLTQMLFEIGDFCTEHWRGITLGFILTIAFVVWLMTNRQTKPLMDRVKLKIPVIGPLIFKSAMARSTQTLSTLVSAGIPILRGLEMAEKTADNTLIASGYTYIQDATKQGQALGDAAERTKIFPMLVCQMMRIGEETGHLDDTLAKVAEWFYQELDEQVRVMTSLLEPIMIVFVGGIVAVIAMAIFGPITSAISQIG